MNCSGLLKNSASRASRQKTKFTLRKRSTQRGLGQIQDHQVSGVRDRRLHVTRRRTQIFRLSARRLPGCGRTFVYRQSRDRLFGKTPGSVDAQLQKLRQATCPFINSPEKNQRQMGPRDYAGSHENVAAGSNLYCWPGSNLPSGARQPASSTSLLGLRTDKEAKDFVRE